jgi:excisionase family DNA binding protein
MPKNTKRVRIFSALETANLCGVVNQTAINWIKSGHLKAFLTPGGQYRIYSEDLVAFLKERSMRIPDELAEDLGPDLDWSTILIVDDDESLNTILKRVFERRFFGYTVVQAFDGFEAGRLISETRPGFIMLDVDLPGVDGRAICRRIKQDPVFGKPFVVVMTGMDSPDIEAIMIAEGADAFFAKPFDMETYMQTVMDFCAIARGR